MAAWMAMLMRTGALTGATVYRKNRPLDWCRDTTGRQTSPVLWRSKMQKTVSLSSAEAEYFSASEMAVEIIYLRNLLASMRLPYKDDTSVLEDNTACIE